MQHGYIDLDDLEDRDHEFDVVVRQSGTDDELGPGAGGQVPVSTGIVLVVTLVAASLLLLAVVVLLVFYRYDRPLPVPVPTLPLVPDVGQGSTVFLVHEVEDG